MALPKSKYSEPRHTPGREFTLGGVDYVGWYVITYQDKVYTGKTLTESSKRLTPVSESLPINTAVFVEQLVQPTEDDRLRGVWKRYLLQNRKNLAIVEVTKSRYDLFKNKSNIVRVTLDWIIKGPAQDVKKGPYIYKGAENKNRETVLALEKNFPGISNYFKNYSEFVE